MEWINTPESSSIQGFGYEAATEILTIKFIRGDVYDYISVEPNIFNEMKLASSKGEYFHDNIKNKYKYRQGSQ